MSATVIFLYVIIIGWNQGGKTYERTPHPTYASCFAALERTKIVVSNGNENEAIAVAFCGGKDQVVGNDGYWYLREQP